MSTSEKPITLRELQNVGRALFGNFWKQPLADALGWTERHILYIVAGERDIPVYILDQKGRKKNLRDLLSKMLRDRQRELGVLAGKIACDTTSRREAA